MTYRNKNLLQAAKDAPRCFACGLPNTGTVVAAHSNQQRDGKGMGHKAADYRVAYLCHDCHDIIDNGSLKRLDAQLMWESAHRASIGWLFESGLVGGDSMSDDHITHTLTQNGKVLTETRNRITMPADCSFSTVNDYVHDLDVHFEDLQALCLGMAGEMERMRAELVRLEKIETAAKHFAAIHGAMDGGSLGALREALRA